MPDPKTNRERLLRLIDGGVDALKEYQIDEPAKPAPSSAAPTSAPTPAKKPAFARLASPRVRALAKLAGLFIAMVACFYYGLEALKSLKPAVPAASVAVPAADGADSTGLRLVGVDSSGPPVALLEDLQTGKTYFARENERVKGVRVKQIEKNKVVVSANGRNVELH